MIHTIRLSGSGRRAAEHIITNTSLNTSGLLKWSAAWTVYNFPETDSTTLVVDFDAGWSRGERAMLNLISAFGRPSSDGAPGGPMFLSQLLNVDEGTRTVAHEAIGIFAGLQPSSQSQADGAPCCATKPGKAISYMCSLPKDHGGQHIATAAGIVVDHWAEQKDPAHV